MSSAPQSAVHLFIQGRVQGVGFRYFTQETAGALGVAGWVCNGSDGAVEAWGQGAPEVLEAWIKKVRQGPPLSRVEKVLIDWQTPLEDMSTFEIR